MNICWACGYTQDKPLVHDMCALCNEYGEAEIADCAEFDAKADANYQAYLEDKKSKSES